MANILCILNIMLLFSLLYFVIPHLCCCYHLTSKCVLYKIIGCNFDIMYSKYIECIVVILFTLLFCFLDLCCMGILSRCNIIVLDCVVSMRINFCNFIYYIVICNIWKQEMTLKCMHLVTADFCVSNWFCNPNCGCYDIGYL